RLDLEFAPWEFIKSLCCCPLLADRLCKLMLTKCNADLRSLLALGAIILTSGIALATAAATAGRVEWRFHA
uniref:Aa_trans domain-containing protein n=1 Tax=Macrostomum lignano TaxID=282301 RepID=A0A1I8JJX6_9PLAT